MQRVALIANPASGPNKGRREAALREAEAVFHAAGVEAALFTSTSSTSCIELTHQAIAAGCDVVIACGGDGTVHAVLQALVGKPVALGVIPLGTANALAANLGLMGAPSEVVPKLLRATPTAVRTGLISYQNIDHSRASRHFLVAAGVGADALLMARMDPRLKRKLGYLLYLWEALRIWATDPFPLFEAKVTLSDEGEPHTVSVSQLLAVRIRSFGGAIQELVPDASMKSRKLNLVAFQTRSRMRILRFALAVICRRHSYTREIDLFNAQSVECKNLKDSSQRLYVEADGELLGLLPSRLEIAPEKVILLVPQQMTA